jgi:serine/threonine-protein kinase
MASGPPAKAVRPPIGNYQILAHVATGGMGAVYKAVDSRLGREVALKVLLPDQAAQKPLLLKRFRLEARYGGQLNHENIVTLYEYGEVHGIHFLALEFVHGVSLLEHIAHKGKLEVEESRQIIIQATRAIAHLHKHGIIHRDIKPSNFLIAERKGGPFVKLVDLGLARRVNDDGPRVTLAGTTLGTVDYLAPEQARDSGSADVRSDIYSLGCTWYQMLSGRPPFAEGTVADRIYKHVTLAPPDIRKANPSVTPEVADILGRMLAKSPADRYQTPEQLLLALEGEQALERESDTEIPPVPVAGPRDLLSDLAEDEDAAAARKRRTARREFLDYERRQEQSRFVPKSVTRRQEKKIWAIGAGAISAVLVFVLAMVYFQSPKRESPVISKPESLQGDRSAEPASQPGRQEEPPAGPARFPAPDPSVPSDPEAIPVLYRRTIPIDVENLREKFEGPWKNRTPPLSAQVFHVGQHPQNGAPPQFQSLAAALGAAGAGRETIIELDDSGPLFTPPLTFQGRSLTLRAGRGYRPLIVWDSRGAAREQATRFLSLTGGNLHLENIDIVAKTIDTHQVEASALFHTTNGSFRAENCTFSLAGNHAQGVALVRLEATHPSSTCRCRLDNCLVRGAETILLDTRAPGAEVLVKDCLVIGGRRPLISIGPSYATQPTTVRAWRSTLVADRRFVHVHSRPAASAAESFHWLGWDTLIAREGIEPSGDLIALLDRAVPGNVRWEATNCLYAGWTSLLTTPTQNVSDLDSWHAIWHFAEGDLATAETWPAVAHPDPAEAEAADFQTARTNVRFAATSRPGALGCDVTTLPPSRHWLDLIR